MALKLQPTLGEVRAAVLSRCGLATEGNVPRGIQSVIDERIRSAQTVLYEFAPWLASFVERDIDLVSDNTDYDCPDDTEPGQIQFVCVRRIQDGYLFPLAAGVRPWEPNATINETVSIPTRYYFVDQVIRVLPKADITLYDKLHLSYQQTPGPLVEDGERVTVDGEALKMLSEIMVKEHFGGQDTQALSARLTQYVDKRRGRGSDGAGFQMGGYRSAYSRMRNSNRFCNTWASYGPDWHPW